MKPDFDKAQNAATELILRQDIKDLYIDVRDFALPPNVIIVSIQEFSRNTGFDITELERRCVDGACLVNERGFSFIFYDNRIQNEQRKHWGIAHELGHVFLMHTDDDKKSEIEAHFFAAQIVTPEIVLWDICKRQGSLYDYELLNCFNVSAEAASKRISTLKRRNRYNYALQDRQLSAKFAPIVDRKFPIRERVS